MENENKRISRCLNENTNVYLYLGLTKDGCPITGFHGLGMDIMKLIAFVVEKNPVVGKLIRTAIAQVDMKNLTTKTNKLES